jgi:hypothetical protein
MPRVPDNPDRDLSEDEIDNLDVDTLRSLLARSDAVELFDAATRERIGRAIARATSPQPPQTIVPQQQQMQQQQQQQQQPTEPDESNDKT